jgi:polyhydroxyalkanoate synthesis regulator phasin
MSEETPKPTGSHGFFAAWLLLHEKADDWLRDAMKRARETPEETRRDYQEFLLGVDREKEMLKGVFADALVNELRHMGFSHRDDSEDLKAEIQTLRGRIAGLEEKLERFVNQK